MKERLQQHINDWHSSNSYPFFEKSSGARLGIVSKEDTQTFESLYELCGSSRTTEHPFLPYFHFNFRSGYSVELPHDKIVEAKREDSFVSAHVLLKNLDSCELRFKKIPDLFSLRNQGSEAILESLANPELFPFQFEEIKTGFSFYCSFHRLSDYVSGTMSLDHGRAEEFIERMLKDIEHYFYDFSELARYKDKSQEEYEGKLKKVKLLLLSVAVSNLERYGLDYDYRIS